MADLNVVTLVGRLTKDAELSKTKNGVSVLTFTFANNQDRKKRTAKSMKAFRIIFICRISASVQKRYIPT